MNSLQQSIALGPLGFSISQLLIVAAFCIALLVGALLGRRHRIPVVDTLLTLLLLALAGAGTLFVVRHWSSYDGIASIIDIRDGGFDPLAGLMVGLAYAFWITWRHPLQRLPLAGAMFSGTLAWRQMQQDEEDMTFVFVNQGEEARQVERFLTEYSLELDNVLLDVRNSLGEVTGSIAMPSTLFYDADGQLNNTHFGELSRATLLSGIENLR